MPCAPGQIEGFGPARVGTLIIGRLRALVELQAETVHQLRGRMQVDPPRVQIGLQVGPGVLVEPSHRVAVHRGMEDHVQQPDRLERLPEGPRGPGRHLMEVGGHPLQLRCSLSIGFLLGLSAARGKPLRVVHHGLEGDDHRVEKRVLLHALYPIALGLRVGENAPEPLSQQPGIIRHDMAEDRMDGQPSSAGFLPLGLRSIVRKASFRV